MTADEILKMGIFADGEIVVYDGAVVFDARGNGDGKIAPTLTGDHEGRITDYTAIVIDVGGEKPTSLVVRERCGCEGGGKGFLVQNDMSGTLTAGNDQFIFLSGSVNLDSEFYAIGNGQAAQLDLHDKAGALNCMHDKEAVVYCLQGNCIDRADTAACNGSGFKEGVSYTLNTVDRHAVCVLCKDGELRYITFLVRRLTPTECARLQGMPDWWCADVPHADAPEYKMWGNGMALPNVLYIFEGLAKYAGQQEDV